MDSGRRSWGRWDSVAPGDAICRRRERKSDRQADMTEPLLNPIEIGLVLQGGGALGAYECGAITALLELMDAATQQGRQVALKAVSGVSIGAVNAGCIVGSQSRADACARLMHCGT